MHATESNKMPPLTPAENYDGSPLWPKEFLLSNSICDCNGHGACINGSSVCTCDDGWSGRSDFINAEGVQCHINIFILTALWLGTMLLGVASTMFTIKKFRKAQFLKYRKRKRFAKIKNTESSTEILKPGMLPFHTICLLAFVCLTVPMVCATGIVRLTMTDQRVGQDFLLTTLWFVVRSTFYMEVGFHQNIILMRMLQAVKGTDNVLRLNLRVSIAFMILSVITGSFGFVSVFLGSSGIQTSRSIFGIFLASQTMLMFSFSIQAWLIEKKCYHLFTQAYESTKKESILVVRAKITKWETTILILSGIQGFILLVWCVTPPLWIAHDYFLPISWVAMCSLGFSFSRFLESNDFVTGDSNDTLDSAGIDSGRTGIALTVPSIQAASMYEHSQYT